MSSVEGTGNAAESDLRRDALAVLRKHWGYDDFRKGQWTAVSAALTGRDGLIILPTGGGKSLCYQVPALVLEGLTLVISPLVALMEDQVAQLRARGIAATYINSTLSHAESERRWNEALFGKLDLLYMAPERLQTDVFRARAERLGVCLLAVDEAHCISEWGHSFRPSYLQIVDARDRLGGPTTLAVTATATPHVRRDIERHLALRSPVRIVTGFDRPNLVWSIFRTENKQQKLQEILGAVSGTGIVYCGTRRGTEEWASWMRERAVSAACYHGGMTAEARSSALEAWLSGEVRVMSATNAFGMGIDKPDVRFVVHVDMPATIESYYQEAGRGGRDGKRAHAVLLYRPGDADMPASLLERSHPNRALVRQVYESMCSMNAVAIGEQPSQPLLLRLNTLARACGRSRADVLSALELLTRQGVISAQEADEDVLFLRFSVTPPQLRAAFAKPATARLHAFVAGLMRAVPAEAFGSWTRVNHMSLSQRLGLSSDRLLRSFGFLSERGLLQWFGGGDAVMAMLLEPRSAHVPYDEAVAARARRRAETRLAEMERYARSASCRRQFLLAYFGERAPERCGRCDVCLGRHAPVVVTPADEPLLRQILENVAADRPRLEWSGAEAVPPHRIDGLVDWLLQEGYLRVSNPLEERFSLTEEARRFRRRPLRKR